MSQRINQETIFTSPVVMTGGVVIQDSPIAYLQSQFPNAAIRMGLVDGVSGFRKQGFNFDVDKKSVPETIWPHGGLYPWPTGEFQASVKSTSSNDTLAGSAAQQVKLIGLAGDDWDQVVETIDMKGKTVVYSSRTDWRRLDRALVSQCGDESVNLGKITIAQKGSGDVLCEIEENAGQTQLCVLTMPNGKRGAILGVDGSMLRGANSTDAEITLYTRENQTGNEAWRLRASFGLKGAATSGFSEEFTLPILVPARTDIELRVRSVDTNNVGVAGVFQIIGIEDRIIT